MDHSRLEFQALLESLEGLATDPTMKRPAVYFQPPAGIQMVYPCIRYTREPYFDFRSDNQAYVLYNRYSVYVIDPDPDTEIPKNLIKLFQQCYQERNYIADNLNHYVFTIYY